MNRNRQIQLAVFALLASLALSACNTIKGVGQDVQKAGEVVEETADDASR